MAILNNLERESVLRFSAALKCRLQNKELLEQLLNYLNSINFEGSYPIILLENTIIIGFKNGDTIVMIVEDSRIKCEINYKSQSSFKLIEILYLNNDIITVKTSESISQTDEDTGLPKIIKRHNETKEYKNNELVYHQSFSTIASSSLTNIACETSSHELFVDESRTAYIRDIRISTENNNALTVAYNTSFAFHDSFISLEEPEEKEPIQLFPCDEKTFIDASNRIRKPSEWVKKS